MKTMVIKKIFWAVVMIAFSYFLIGVFVHYSTPIFKDNSIIETLRRLPSYAISQLKVYLSGL